MKAHMYDQIGICIYCDRCNDPLCCEMELECDNRHWTRTISFVNGLQEERKDGVG